MAYTLLATCVAQHPTPPPDSLCTLSTLPGASWLPLLAVWHCPASLLAANTTWLHMLATHTAHALLPLQETSNTAWYWLHTITAC